MLTPRRLALLAVLAAVTMALPLLSVPGSAAAPAPVPVWQAGQSVGYGTHMDIGAIADPYLNAVRSNPSRFNITTINALNVTGSLDSWEVDTVTEATPTYYTLGSQSADGIKLHVVANLTLNDLPVAGTYPGTMSFGFCLPPTLPTAAGTLAVTLDATSLSVTSGALRLQTSNLAYVNGTDNVSAQASVAFTSYHLPSTDFNSTACTETVTYESPSFTLTADTRNQARAYYGAWDYFNFPISDNKTWWANTTATLSGTLTGTINVQGLSSQDEKAFFDNLTRAFQSAGLTVSGLSSFPIDLAKVTIMAGTSYIVNNGVITDYPLPLDANYRAISSVETLSDGNQYPVYLITDAAYQCPAPPGNFSLPIGYAAVYAPDFPAAGAGMIVGYELLVCGGTMNVPGFALTNTRPSDAHAKIGQTEANYAVTPPATSNGVLDFFVKAPYWGILILVVAVAAIVGFVVLRRRRRLAATPPPTEPVPPQTPPPPGPPGAP